MSKFDFEEYNGRYVYCILKNSHTRCGRNNLLRASTADAINCTGIVLCVDCLRLVGKKWRNGTHKKLKTPSWY